VKGQIGPNVTKILNLHYGGSYTPLYGKFIHSDSEAFSGTKEGSLYRTAINFIASVSQPFQERIGFPIFPSSTSSFLYYESRTTMFIRSQRSLHLIVDSSHHSVNYSRASTSKNCFPSSYLATRRLGKYIFRLLYPGVHFAGQNSLGRDRSERVLEFRINTAWQH